MIVKCLRAGSLMVVGGGLLFLMSGCVVDPYGRVYARPVVVAPRPVYVEPPPVYAAPEPVLVPETYVWDGVEYVGVVGDQYYYLGPGNVWLIAEPFRLERFHGWEREHRDWREHAIRNERFRNDRYGHFHPAHVESRNAGHGKPLPRKREEH
jgi:hypothetical protein